MRMTRLHAPTLKEDPKDAEVTSHRLLVRGGFIRKLAAGIYDFLPLGQRVLRKIQNIVREEMDRAGAVHLLTHNILNLSQYTLSQREEVINSSSELPDKATTNEQTMARDLGVFGIFLKSGRMQACHPHDDGLLMR